MSALPSIGTASRLAGLLCACALAACPRADSPRVESPRALTGSPPPTSGATLATEGHAALCPEELRAESLGAERRLHLTIAGERRAVTVWAPGRPAPAPLLLAFHGTGGDGPSFFRRARLSAFVDAGFVVAAPDGVGHGTLWPVWDAMRLPGDDRPNLDVTLVDALIACLVARPDVDEERVFVAGHSAGGIFVNHLLQARSGALAGGIAGSGVFELTAEGVAPEDLAPMTVIVAWGGANDVYTGETRRGTRVAGFPFDEQGALASRFYAAAPAVRHFQCRGRDRGHAWLAELNTWFAATLLTDPEAPPPAPPRGACAAEPAELPPPLSTAPCDDGPDRCGRTCAALGACLLANGTVGPLLAGALEALGVGPRSCAGCVRACGASGGVDRALWRCLGTEPELACGPGIRGAMPMIERLNACCAEHRGAAPCRSFCGGIPRSSAAAPVFPVCWRP